MRNNNIIKNVTESDIMINDILVEYDKVYKLIDSNRLDDMLMKAYKMEDTNAVSYILDLKKIIDMYCVLKDVEASILDRYELA